ncbi:MAG TPA: head-tail connector protein, partial [Saprospiraceae bacterium]|nr:head-tail connector protein [Saprospiraceae bacterium]
PLATESNNVTSIAYLTTEGDAATIDISNLVLCNIATPPYIKPKVTEWPTTGSNIIITYTATQHYDYDIYKPAIMMLVAHLAENREIVESKFENSLTNLLSPLRVMYHG